ncbi:hypothetical protein ES703_15672 [subsurface metagenome]
MVTAKRPGYPCVPEYFVDSCLKALVEGLCGYKYVPKTGKRLVKKSEAQVMRRIFRLSCCVSKSNLSEKIGKTVERFLEWLDIRTG